MYGPFLSNIIPLNIKIILQEGIIETGDKLWFNLVELKKKKKTWLS